MANYFNLILDTTGPSSPSVVINSGDTYASAQLVDLTIGTTDSTTTSYQMKVWGDIDLTWGKANGIINSSATTTLEEDALWITYATSKQVTLTASDANKTVYIKIRDDVYNESSSASSSIILNTHVPVVTISGPDVSKISKIAGKNTSSFSFIVDYDITDYSVRVVSSTSALHNSGTEIPTTAGSVNMSLTAGSILTGESVDCQITGTDLQTASSGDGAKIIKVFVKDSTGVWSV